MYFGNWFKVAFPGLNKAEVTEGTGETTEFGVFLSSGLEAVLTI